MFFRSAVSGYSTENSRFNVCVMPLLVTEDMKAHAEIYLTCAGSGKKGCRRCEVGGVYIRPEPRKAEGSLRNGLEVENAVTKTQKAELSKRYGVTGVCILYRWHLLCGI